MADLAALAAIGGAQALQAAPAPPQRPYAADPGMLTGWLTMTTMAAQLDHDGVLASQPHWHQCKVCEHQRRYCEDCQAGYRTT